MVLFAVGDGELEERIDDLRTVAMETLVVAGKCCILDLMLNLGILPAVLV